jgi:hypothetical protein
VTGFAVLQESTVLVLGELVHKTTIKSALDTRRSLRRTRRNRKTRYREPGRLRDGGKNCLGKKREEPMPLHRRKGWLAPSLVAHIQQTTNLVAKLRKLLPVATLSTEHVKFDTQLLEHPDISGVEYQQGTLFGYEVKEYLLERDGRKCAYCQGENVPLEIEHIVPKSRGGSNQIANLTLSCRPCNQKKGNQTAAEFGFPQVQQHVKKSLRDAAKVNATRWRLFNRLQETGLPVEAGTGARTKYQRIQHGLPKQHYFDAACVGASTPPTLTIDVRYVQRWKAMGRGNRQLCQPNKYGFPQRHRSRAKVHHGFMTGDLVRGFQPKSQLSLTGRVTVRADGNFYIKPDAQKQFNFTVKNATFLQRSDGWSYGQVKVQG